MVPNNFSILNRSPSLFHPLPYAGSNDLLKSPLSHNTPSSSFISPSRFVSSELPIVLPQMPSASLSEPPFASVRAKLLYGAFKKPPLSPIKKDSFLPTETDLLERLSTGSGTSSDSDSTSMEQPSQHCPCCGNFVNLHGTSFHSHLIGCLKESGGSPKVSYCSTRSSSSSSSNDRKKITEIRGLISKLNLHLRIGIMESLYRLSRGVDCQNPPSPHYLPTSGTNAEQSDKQVLALLYGRNNKRRKRRAAGTGGYDMAATDTAAAYGSTTSYNPMAQPYNKLAVQQSIPSTSRGRRNKRSQMVKGLLPNMPAGKVRAVSLTKTLQKKKHYRGAVHSTHRPNHIPTFANRMTWGSNSQISVPDIGSYLVSHA